MSDAVHGRERAFWDAATRDADAAAMPPAPPHRFEQALLERLGPVAGRDVLDAGAGLGDLTLALLDRGARVTALDLSEQSLRVLRARAERWRPGAQVRVLAAPLEETGLPDEAFDLVVGKWVLHHADLRRAAPEVARILRPGGRAAFFENQDRNPLLRVARERLLDLPGVVRVGTRDERPLGEADFELLRAAFARVEVGYPNLYFLEAFGRAVLGGRANRLLELADQALWRRFARLRPFSYHVLVEATRARAGVGGHP